MVASILAKKKTAGATHVLIDIPVGSSAKVKSSRTCRACCRRCSKRWASGSVCELEIVTTQALGPIGYGIGPRLEALDVLSVLRCESGAPADLREKSLMLAGRLLEMTGVEPPSRGYEAARRTLDSGAALRRFDRIVDAQGRREMPPEARLAARLCGRTSRQDYPDRLLANFASSKTRWRTVKCFGRREAVQERRRHRDAGRADFRDSRRKRFSAPGRARIQQPIPCAAWSATTKVLRATPGV